MRSLILSALFFFCASATVTAGGPWPQPKGSAYLKLSEWWIIADQHFTDNGQIDPNVTGGIYQTFLYGEYGLSDRWTLVGNLGLFSRATVNNVVSGTTGELLIPGDAINSLGDSELGIKFALNANRRVALSATLTLGLPLGQSLGGSQDNLQTGDGEFNQLLRFDTGTGFRLGSLPAYASAYGGFNQRTNGFSDEWRFGLEAGVRLLSDKLGLTGRLDIVESLRNGDAANNPAAATGVFANNTEFVSISGEISYAIGRNWGLAAGVGGAVSGALIYAAPAYNVGVYWQPGR